MMNLADSELVARYAAGGADGEAAFAEIVRRHGGLVYAACRRRLPEAAAEDAVQAVFMLMARKARTLSRREALAGWLYGAAMLVAREGLRSARRRERAEEEGAAMREAARRAPAGPEWSQLRPELDAALAALPRQYRDAVLLACAEGRSEAEAARELGVPPGTVKSRVSRGLERLRERLGQRGVISSVAALGSLLGAHGAEAMPAALAAKVTVLGKAGATAAAGTAAGSASLAMMEGAMKAMFWMKLKLAAVLIGAAAAVGGGGTAVILAAAEPAAPKAEAPKAESPKPAAEAGKVAWGEAAEGLQAGLVPLGGGAAKGWSGFSCPTCSLLSIPRDAPVPCKKCGVKDAARPAVPICSSCAVQGRVCARCGAAKPSGAAFAEGEAMSFEIHLRNTGEAPKEITGAGRESAHNLVFVPKGGGTPRQARSTAARPMGGGGMAPQHLGKGQEAAWTMSFGGADWQFEDATKAPRDAALAAPVKSLPPGRYTVTAAYAAAKVTTGAVEIEIKAAAGSSVPAGGAEPRDPGSRPDRPAAGEWQKLFADEDWYKNQAGQEQVFTGTLEGIPVVEGMATTLQRDSYYKLGGRTLYTGAKKLPALDALVGKKVEIRGKPVDMALEGQNLKEIWPAEAREAK